MARKTPSRLELRKQAEAAEQEAAEQEAAEQESGGTKKKTKKKAARKKATRTKRVKTKTIERKKLVWGVFSGSLKEEARFPYDQRDEAEAKLKQMLAKGKKLYFIQPIKEIITETITEEVEPAAKKAKAAK